jgi:hypothetical protein
MTKKEMLQKNGNKKVRDVAGILHNYVIGDEYPEHEMLEDAIKPYMNYDLKEAIKSFDHLLEFE